jgi:N4-gp56 family major capsid protein
MAGQVWVTNSLGGHLTSPELSRKVRVAAQPLMRFRQFVRPEQEFGANKGDTLQFDKVSNVATEGRIISELEVVPETQITIYKDSITVSEFSNSIPFTWKLELLAKLDINSMLVEALKNDMAKVLDKYCAAEFKTTDLKYSPTGNEQDRDYDFETDGTAGTAQRPMSLWDVKNVADLAKSTYHMPFFDGNNYMTVASTTYMRSLKDDSEFIDMAKYGDPKRLFDGELGRVYGVRHTEETNALDGNLAGGLGEALFFGGDAVVEMAVYPEEIQAKIGSDYGRDKGLRWVWIGGFALTWDYSSEGEARVIHITSA